MGRSTPLAMELTKFPLTLAAGLRTTFADVLPMPFPERLAALMRRLNTEEGESEHGASSVKAPYRIDRRGRSRPATPPSTLLEDEQLDTVECESAEAALAIMLMRGRDISMIFADVRLPGAMDGVDLAWEVRMRWPLLPIVLTSGHSCERAGDLPPGVVYLPKPWQPLNVLMIAEQALSSSCAA